MLLLIKWMLLSGFLSLFLKAIFLSHLMFADIFEVASKKQVNVGLNGINNYTFKQPKHKKFSPNSKPSMKNSVNS